MKSNLNEYAERAILDMLEKRIGEKNAITDKMIRETITVLDPDLRKPTAGLRDIINSLRQKGNPICSGINGYWYAEDEVDLEQNIGALEGRALKIMSATKGMRETLVRWKSTGQGRLI
jgi:hypothetical protein